MSSARLPAPLAGQTAMGGQITRRSEADPPSLSAVSETLGASCGDGGMSVADSVSDTALRPPRTYLPERRFTGSTSSPDASRLVPNPLNFLFADHP